MSFTKEKQNVFLTVISFDLFYAVRIITAIFFIPNLYSGIYGRFWGMEGSLIIYSLLDMTP